MYINSEKGTVHIIYNGNDNVSIKQEGAGEVIVSVSEMEALGKAILGKHRKILSKLSPPPKPKPVLTAKKVRPLSYIDQQKAIHENAYQPWTTEDDQKLRKMIGESRSISEMAGILGRNEGSIRSRMKKLKL